MQPSDIRAQVVLEEHDMSADATFAIVVRRFVQRDGYASELWRVPLDGDKRRGAASRGGATRLTNGRVRDTRPRISPDGRRVAFLRRELDGREKPGRLMVMDLTRRARPTALFRGDFQVSDLAWSPNGDRVAFTAEVDEPRFIVGSKPKPKQAPLARRITRIDWRFDETGHVDRWDHLFVVDTRRGSVPQQLTEGDFRVDGITWRPDGRAIAFSADPGPNADVRPRASIWMVELPRRGAKRKPDRRELLALRGWANSPAWSPDGTQIAAVGVDSDPITDDIAPGLFVARVSASGPVPAAVAIAPELDRPIGDWVDTDLEGWMASSRFGPYWPVADAIVTTVSDRGRSRPWIFPIDRDTGRSPEPRPLAQGDLSCRTLAVAAPGGQLRWSFVGTNAGRAMELMTSEDDRIRTRTAMGSAWQRRFDMPEMRVVEAPGSGGPIETWIASPRGAGDSALPTIVDVHGGPLGAWAPTPSIEVMLLCARGYRVVLPNIRGSATYGAEWIRPQLGDWGGVDAADVHSALDHVISLGLADPKRLGVLGLSYGGFMVQWLIGTSDRFAAAVSENGVANQVSDWANSDTGVDYNRTSKLGDPLTHEGMLKLWRQSPLAHVSNVHTPLLMLQGEADRRCPAADNEQYFIALRVLGREVEYVLYPDEFHVYSITGRPDRRIDRMTRMLEWFDRHLAP
jgi:dipeptidyl aminopeptidase/acylaminoacyl peptidase